MNTTIIAAISGTIGLAIAARLAGGWEKIEEDEEYAYERSPVR
jgi:hypothetical protein